ncbi:hypothetical protein INT45_010995 [Circinella minor]|uniref:Uncharacterized protein n=1 Tax=Circinella minor TaxID=1195481 RepID=A0A8H7VTH4_9FUNG|nr:hypothetical protein INT45_010995 [Circinella minor]
MDDDDKIMSDRAKVNRESKDDLDCILEHCTDDEWVDRLARQFQSSGSTAQLNTIHLCVVTDLFSWSNDMYRAGDFLLSKIKKQHNISKGIEALSTIHHLLQRDTTYSPPEKAIWPAFHSSTSSIPQPPESSTSSSTSSTQDLTFDSNGWARVGNQWYNCLLKEYWDESRYTEKDLGNFAVVVGQHWKISAQLTGFTEHY